MDIHKPKPWHGVREFLKEYLIIVVGVLTALGGEQVAEAFHWRHEVEVERAALRSEVRDNIAAALYRRSQQACIEARLAQLAEVYRRHASGRPLGIKGKVERLPIWVATTGSWDIAVSGQALGHMPQKEKLAFSDAFDAFKAFASLREQEDAYWRRLAFLDHSDLLDTGDWSRLHEAYAEATGMNSRMQGLINYVLGPAALGEKAVMPNSGDADDNRRFCAPLI